MGFTAQFLLGLFLVLLICWTSESSYQKRETQIINNDDNKNNKNDTIEQNNNEKEDEKKMLKNLKQKYSTTDIPKTDNSDVDHKNDNNISSNKNIENINNITKLENINGFNNNDNNNNSSNNNDNNTHIGRSINIDKYTSKEFHSKDNEFSLPLSSDTEKYVDPNYSYHMTTLYTNEDYHKFNGILTTPKSPIFDQKYKEAVKSIEHTLDHMNDDDEDETRLRRHHQHLHGDDSKLSKITTIQEIDDKLKRNDTKRFNFINYKNVIKNHTDDKNSKHQDILYEEETKLDYVGSFNNTEIIDENPIENKINKEDDNKDITKEEKEKVVSSSTTITAATVTTTQRNEILTTTSTTTTSPSTTIAPKFIELSNKIEHETIKPLQIPLTTTVKPEIINDNENKINKNKEISSTSSSTTTTTVKIENDETVTTATTINDEVTTTEGIAVTSGSTTESPEIITEPQTTTKINDEVTTTATTTKEDVTTTENGITVTPATENETTQSEAYITNSAAATTTIEVSTVTAEVTTLTPELTTVTPDLTTIKKINGHLLSSSTSTADVTTEGTTVTEFTVTPVIVTQTEPIRTNIIDFITSTTTLKTKNDEMKTESSYRTSKSMTLPAEVTTVSTIQALTEPPKAKPDIFEYDSNEEFSQEHFDKTNNNNIINNNKQSSTSTSTEIVIFESVDNHTTLLPEILKPDFKYPIPEIDNIGETKSGQDFEETTTQTTIDSDGLTLEPSDNDNSGTIAAIAISSVGGVCLILLAGLLIIMKKRQKRFNYGKRCRPVSLDDYSMDNISVQNSIRRKGGVRASKRSYGNPAFDDPSTINHPLNFSDLMKFASNSEDIQKEFEEIPQIIARTTELPDGCDIKNRYANVIPLPETRVFLVPIDGVPNSDYINANYVTGPKNTKGYYIACQAPMENTVDDFWRMIWEQQSKVILMLTLLYENRTEKCFDYLPPSEVLDCHRLFGDFQVTLKKREVKDKYIISSLQLKNMVTNSWREVTHFWYLGWPEKGVPSEANSLIAFLIEARSYMKTSSLDRKQVTNGDLNSGMIMNHDVSPVVVHCSPGTGRTGVVIACDIAIREFEQTRIVDVPRIVYRIRRDRANAVQTKEQYTFIYKVIGLYASKLTGGALDSF